MEDGTHSQLDLIDQAASADNRHQPDFGSQDCEAYWIRGRYLILRNNARGRI